MDKLYDPSKLQLLQDVMGKFCCTRTFTHYQNIIENTNIAQDVKHTHTK